MDINIEHVEIHVEPRDAVLLEFTDPCDDEIWCVMVPAEAIHGWAPSARPEATRGARHAV